MSSTRGSHESMASAFDHNDGAEKRLSEARESHARELRALNEAHATKREQLEDSHSEEIADLEQAHQAAVAMHEKERKSAAAEHEGALRERTQAVNDEADKVSSSPWGGMDGLVLVRRSLPTG